MPLRGGPQSCLLGGSVLMIRETQLAVKGIELLGKI
jgi:hypothetical protein